MMLFLELYLYDTRFKRYCLEKNAICLDSLNIYDMQLVTKQKVSAVVSLNEDYELNRYLTNDPEVCIYLKTNYQNCTIGCN